MSLFARDDRHRYAPGVENAHVTLIEGYKQLIHMPSRRGAKFELFDIKTDMDETVDLFDAQRADHPAMAERLLKRRRAGGSRTTGELDPEALERLRALGYIK